MRIVHFRNRCIGCNACIEQVPHRWKMSPIDGKAVLAGAVLEKGAFKLPVPEDERDAHARAAAHCPVDIIKIEG